MSLCSRNDHRDRVSVVDQLAGRWRGARRSKRRSLGLLVTLFAIGSGCDQLTDRSRSANRQPAVAPEAPPPLETAVIELGSVTETKDLPFEIIPYESTDLVARVEGYVKEIKVDIGDEVTAGQVLVSLSAGERLADIVRWQNKVSKARVDRETSHALLAQVGSHREEQLTLKRLNESKLATTEGLVRRGGLAEEQLDQAQFSLESAEAALGRVDADVAAAEAQLRSAEAEIQVVEAELARVQVWAQYLTIAAPFDGLITHRNVDHGDLVRPESREGASLLTVDRVDQVKLVLYVGIENGAQLDVGDAVAVTAVEGRPTPKLAVQNITRYARAFHRKTRTVRVEVDIENVRQNKGGQRWFEPGEYGLARITLNDLRDVQTVPAAAVNQLEDGEGSILIGPDTSAQETRVRVLASGQPNRSGRIAIEGIGEALENGAQIIADFQQFQERKK